MANAVKNKRSETTKPSGSKQTVGLLTKNFKHTSSKSHHTCFVFKIKLYIPSLIKLYNGKVSHSIAVVCMMDRREGKKKINFKAFSEVTSSKRAVIVLKLYHVCVCSSLFLLQPTLIQSILN